ncbi:MAG: DUF4127 family protein [Pleurocapsa minor GSE-CHR-MK-17-07R]|jgi:hypothetical protein|nr:DUF4127 family protein [Pleurocapsa minor GSE-CHR-MK 17-07R]
MKIAVIPLDERPVNTRYLRMVADIAGLDLALPPANALSHLRQPARQDALTDWLAGQSGQADQRIISVESFAYGGLIPSRISDASPLDVMSSLARLEGLPRLPTTAFNVITRIPDANDAIEEPAYWAQHGRRLHRYSQLMHRQQAGQPVSDELDALSAALPPDIVHDFTARRLRNHMVNLNLLHMASRGLFDLLVISSDDTSEFGMGSQEKAWLRTWVGRLGLGEDRLLMYPGADEVGCVLMMRAALTGRPTPTFYVHYAIDADRARIAPYEDSPVAVTVERQIRALGGRVVDEIEQADFIVAVNPPSGIGQEYDPEAEHFASEHARRAPFMEAFAGQIAAWAADGRRVIVCDVAYPNGSDPDLIAHLLAGTDLRRLAAYGAWNTAGNTIGVALAQGVASSLVAGPDAEKAQTRFLLHRFIEDWGYQHLVRQRTRDWLEATTGRRDTTPDNQAEAIAHIHADLSALLPQLGALAEGWRITRVSLPWNRTFEVDFDLEHGS